jgi:hypothetical protein
MVYYGFIDLTEIHATKAGEIKTPFQTTASALSMKPINWPKKEK